MNHARLFGALTGAITFFAFFIGTFVGYMVNDIGAAKAKQVERPQPKFCYEQKAKIVGGFFRGRECEIYEVRPDQDSFEYYVRIYKDGTEKNGFTRTYSIAPVHEDDLESLPECPEDKPDYEVVRPEGVWRLYRGSK